LTISGIDGLAKGLENAAKLIEAGKIQSNCDTRYKAWDSTKIATMDLEALDHYAFENALAPKAVSGRQELLEILAGF
jgi:xylose isomerase